VNNGTFLTGKLAPGASATIKAVVTVGSGTHGAGVERLVTITSNNDSNERDAVELTVTRSKARSLRGVRTLDAPRLRTENLRPDQRGIGEGSRVRSSPPF